MAFISSAKTSSGKGEVNTASILTASTQVSPASADVAAASISHDTILEKDWKKITIQGTDVVSFDKSKVECFNCHKIGHFARECRAPRSQDKGRRENYKQGSKEEEPAPKALIAIDGVGWDWSYMANEEENHDLVEARLVEFKTQEIKFCKKIKGLEFDVESKNNKIERLMNELEQVKKEKEGLDIKLTGCCSPPPAQVYSPSKKDMSWTRLPDFADDTITDYSRPSPSIESNTYDLQNSNASVSEHGESSESIMSKPIIKFVKAGDSLKSLKPLKFDHLAYDCGLWVEKGKNRPKNNLAHKDVTPIADLLKTGRTPGADNFQNNIDDKGYWDSGCSRHMTGNISYLSDYEPYDRGYVSFGQGGGKIIGKGIIKTGKLEFENVYFVKDLKYNMFSVSQICDNKNSVLFTDSECIVLGKDFKLKADTNASADESMLWHMRLGHLNFKTMNKLVRHNLVKGLPPKCFENDHTCVACVKGKQHKASCKTKLVNSMSNPLHTLHMDLFGPTFVSSLNHKWNFITEIENLKDLKVKIIRCDNGDEFKNKEMHEFCTRKGIKKEFSNAKTPQQNRVTKRRNRTLIEAARTMLADAKLPVTFWAEEINTACYVQNRVLVNMSQNKTPYELFNSRTHVIGFLRPFGCHVMILNTLDHLGKFDAKGDAGYFVGYSMSSKAFRVFNKRTKKVEENLHVDFLENKLIEKGAGPNWLFNIDTLTNSMNYVPVVVAGTSYIALPNWFHEAHMESSNNDAQDACNADAPESSGISNPTATSKSPPAEQMESLTVESAIPTVSSPVLTACLDTSPETTSGLRRNMESIIPSLDNALTLSNRFEDILGDTINNVDTNRVEADLINMESIIPASPTPTLRIHKDHPKSQIIGPMDTPVQTRHKFKEMEEHNFIATIHQKTTPDLIKFCLFSCFLSQEEPKKIFDALKDPSWVEAMQEELLQFKIHNVWMLVDCPKEVRPIGTKWVLKNKKDERGIVIRNKGMLVAQGHTQEEGIDYEEVFAPVIKIKAIRLFLAYASFMGFTPPRFQDPAFPDRVYKVERAMYGLHQAPRAWYALTINPTVYVSHIQQFWSTARIETTNKGTKIITTVDGKPRTISESSIRRNLRLNDAEGISTLPDAELFKNLALMGYNILPNRKFTFQKGQFSHQWKFLIHTIMQCLSPKSTGFNKFSSNIATAVVCLATNMVYNFSKMIFDVMGEGSRTPTEPHHTPSPQASQSPHHDLSSPSHPTVTTEIIPTTTPIEIPTLRKYSRRATWIAQSKALPTAVDEPASLLRDTSALPHDSTPKVTSLDANEGSKQQQFQELTDLCTCLQRQQTEIASKINAQDYEISNLKGRSMKIGEEAGVERSTERGSNDTLKMVNVLTSMDAVSILTSGVTDVSVPPVAEVLTIGVPTVSGLVPTVIAIFTTASVVTPYSRRPREISEKDKGKEKMVESDTPKKKKLQEQIDAQVAKELEEEIAKDNQRMNEQIARDVEIARIHAEEELKMMIDGLDRSNEMIAKHLPEYEQAAADLTIGEKIKLINELVKYQDHHAKILKYHAQQSKSLSKKEQKEFYMSVLKIHFGWKTKHFRGMTLEEIREEV
nr:hypothetical protein [Tanacetum cinerariifolium]